MKSEFVIKFWERIGYILYDDEYSAMNSYLWKLPNLESVLQFPRVKKKSSFIDGNDDGLLTSGTN